MASEASTFPRPSSTNRVYHRQDFRRRLWSLTDGSHSFSLPLGLQGNLWIKSLFLLLTSSALFWGWVLDFKPSPKIWLSEWELLWFWGLFVVVAFPVWAETLFNLRFGKWITEALFLSLVTGVAVYLGYLRESIFTLLVFEWLEVFLARGLWEAKRNIEELFAKKPPYARVIRRGEEVSLSPSLIEIGEEVRVLIKEIVPLDGVLLNDQALFSLSFFTGGGETKAVHKGEKVLAGWQLLTSEAVIQTTTIEGGTVLHSLFTYWESALSTTSAFSGKLSFWANLYTLFALILAGSLFFIPWWASESLRELSPWISRSLSVLVLVTPASLFALNQVEGFSTLARAASQGIFFRSLAILDALGQIETLISDQTYTLTLGEFTIREGESQKEPFSEFYSLLAALESRSRHPMARAIVREDKSYSEKKAVIGHVQEWEGEGITGIVNGVLVMAGNERLMERYRIPVPTHPILQEDPCVLVAFDGAYAGFVTLTDTLRPEAEEFMHSLEKLGVDRTVLLSGEKDVVVKRTGFWLGIKSAQGNLNDLEKAQRVYKEMKRSQGAVVLMSHASRGGFFLSKADVRISTDAIEDTSVLETSDIVIFSSDLSKVSEAIQLAKENLHSLRLRGLLSFSLKSLLMVLGAFSLFSFWEVFFSDALISLLALVQILVVHKTKLKPILRRSPMGTL
jgi:Cd2+/Zn2+-exporting ATPase